MLGLVPDCVIPLPISRRHYFYYLSLSLFIISASLLEDAQTLHRATMLERAPNPEDAVPSVMGSSLLDEPAHPHEGSSMPSILTSLLLITASTRIKL
ncbi:hypothetical protein BT67DRAFT_53906 [Trichocladium antarcticum]|uniref:Uncharacterized protein n=1 Tax=Trichocladium antarcticum TaxID=1450529 RepID=A0AAN6UIV4_9PEZI|nr:hypothetical protein BT67DRAFT_53906 [Trichocladium antarcticum]